VMEQIEGITLHTLLQMSITPLSQKEVLGWAGQICDAIQYLHERPQPFIYGVLEPDHIMLTSEGKIKLINYGLNRYFRFDEDSSFTYRDSKDISAEINHFGETVYFLLAREKPGQYGIRDVHGNITPELQKVLSRCLIKDPQRNYMSCLEVKQELETVLAPPPPQPQKSKAAVRIREQRKEGLLARLLPPVLAEPLGRALFAVLGQRTAYLAAELVGVIVLVTFLSTMS
jgi:serine/threonine protein kinase